MAERCYGHRILYAKEQNRLSPDNPPFPDPHDLAFRETSIPYAAVLLELRRDELGGLARDLRGNFRAMRPADDN